MKVDLVMWAKNGSETLPQVLKRIDDIIPLKNVNKRILHACMHATEGFPNAVLEAYACEKPVLVAKESFPQELEIFGSVAEICRFESEIKALKKSDLETLGKQARSYVEKHYTWERFARSTIKYLKRVVDITKAAHIDCDDEVSL